MENLKNKKLFMLDMDGTIYLSDQLFEETGPFLELLEKQGKRFLFLTNNSSKGVEEYLEKLRKMGLPAREDCLLTSGMATISYLKNHLPSKDLFLCATPSLIEDFEKAGFCVNAEKPKAVVIAFDTTLDYAKLHRICDLVRSGLPYFATHPDVNVPLSGGLAPDIGCVISFVKTSTGREPDKIIGKPNAELVETASVITGIDKSEIVMVGDRLATDIMLGINAGISSVLVLSGVTSKKEAQESTMKPQYIFENIGTITDILRS